MEWYIKPTKPTVANPIMEFTPIAVGALVMSAMAPITSDPKGLAPIPRVTIPNALPLISSRETNIAIVPCIVPKHAAPNPKMNRMNNDAL